MGKSDEHMNQGVSGAMSFSFSAAKVILRTRDLRRKLAFRIMVVILILFSLGVFVIDGWLDQHIWPFTIYWFVVFLLTSCVMFIALYDALRVVKEVQDEHNKEMAEDLRNLAEFIRKNKEKDNEKDEEHSQDEPIELSK